MLLIEPHTIKILVNHKNKTHLQTTKIFKNSRKTLNISLTF